MSMPISKYDQVASLLLKSRSVANVVRILFAELLTVANRVRHEVTRRVEYRPGSGLPNCEMTIAQPQKMT